jgi:hypothetical protein
MKRILLSVFAIAALIAMIACGGGGSSSTSTTPGASSAPITINVGDATADRLVAFEVTVNSVTLTGSSGTTNVLPAPTKIELTHLSGKFEPLRLANLPAGTYTGASFQLGSAEAVIIGAAGTAQAGQIIKLEGITPNPTSVSVTFPSVTVGSTASVLSFDFNLGTSVTVTGNAVAFAPSASSITVVTGQANQNENEQEDEDGELEDIHGTVAQVNSNSFVLNLSNNSQQLTFTVDANTEFSDGVTSLSTLKAGMVVKVEGITKADGSLLAKEVEGVEIENGLEAEGIITNTNLTAGVGSITVVVHDASSAAAATSQPTTGDTITVNIDANTRFRVDFGHGKTKTTDPGMAFDALHLGKGQKIEVDDDTARPNNLAARKLALKKQALVGTVSNASSTGFTLTLDASNNFFTQLTGESVIQVKTSSATINKGTAPANGSTIRVRGLLFFDPAGQPGQKYTLAAGRTDHQ